MTFRKGGTMRRIVALSTIALGLVLAGSATAAPPDQQTFQRQGTVEFDCGSFLDVFTRASTIHQLTFYDANGVAIRQVLHVHRVSTDTNSVTGKTRNSSGDFTITSDLVTGSMTIVGQRENTSAPGEGVLVQDVGRLVLDIDGNVAFSAGPHQGSDYCAALA